MGRSVRAGISSCGCGRTNCSSYLFLCFLSYTSLLSANANGSHLVYKDVFIHLTGYLLKYHYSALLGKVIKETTQRSPQMSQNNVIRSGSVGSVAGNSEMILVFCLLYKQMIRYLLSILSYFISTYLLLPLIIIILSKCLLVTSF